MRSWPWTLGRFSAAVLAIAVVAVCVFVLPNLLVPTEATTSPERLVELRNGVRSTLIQALGGLLLFLGAVAAWQQLQMAHAGHITERYARAIEQLGAVGSDGREKIDVQLGGIFALERLARDSPRDQPTIMEVLAAFVRHRASRAHTDTPEPVPTNVDAGNLHIRLPAVQAAIRVIGRIPRPRDVKPELFKVDLRRAILERANLSNAELWDADLSGAYLIDADLSHAALGRTNLTYAFLHGASLTGARLRHANLTDAELAGADLTSADLRNANLIGAHLEGANLSGANLEAANLGGPMLIGERSGRSDLIPWQLG